VKKRRISISRVARDNRLLSLHIEREIMNIMLEQVRVKLPIAITLVNLLHWKVVCFITTSRVMF